MITMSVLPVVYLINMVLLYFILFLNLILLFCIWEANTKTHSLHACMQYVANKTDQLQNYIISQAVLYQEHRKDISCILNLNV